MQWGGVTLGEPKRVVYGPERAFLIARQGRAFFREDAISFFRGDTDPGNLTTVQKQSHCFSILLCFISTFLFFSKLCSQLQTCLSQGKGRMDASQFSSFHPWAAPLLLSKTTSCTSSSWETAREKSYLQAGSFPAVVINWRPRQVGLMQGDGERNETSGQNKEQVWTWPLEEGAEVSRKKGRQQCFSYIWHKIRVKDERMTRHGAAEG